MQIIICYITNLHKMEKFLNKEKNNIISEEIGGGCKVIHAGDAVGENMNPRNYMGFHVFLIVSGLPRFAGFYYWERNREKRLKPP